MTVLMTGGTGFLGLHLLRGHILAGRRVRLLAHAGAVPGLERVRRFLLASGDLERLPLPLERLVSVTDIELDLPTLGLSTDQTEALTHDVDEVWHVAATVMLDGRDEHVWRTNVVGTQNILRLVDRTPAHALYRHVSTAFVAGRTGHADVREEDSTGALEFENAYERSKHAAEAIVRCWADTKDRCALILRPSILSPGDRSPDSLPDHTLRAVGQIASRVAERRPDLDSRLVLRIGADPRAQLNVVQVDFAADAMLKLSEAITSGVRAVHVVHDDDVAVRSIAAALEDIAPVRVRMMPAMPSQPSDEERVFHRSMTGFLPYLHHRRRFDTTHMRAVLPGLPVPPPIGREQLRRWVQPSAIPAKEPRARAFA